MHTSSLIYELSNQLGQVLLRHGLRCVTAESCTGGRLSAAITDIPGSSQWFDRGFVTYTNLAKQQMLGVPNAVLTSFGAVSEAAVCAMAKGALLESEADISVAISGIAGPDGGSLKKPVGTVWLAWAGLSAPTKAVGYCFAGDRLSIRQQAVQTALEGLIQRVNASF